jgi:tRNA (guanine37-N1)-methyltransferase
MRFHVITLFPQSLDSYINESIIGRAQKEKKIEIYFYNPRGFVKANSSQKSKEKPYLRIDDKPYGGGPGMVMQALPMIKAVEAAVKKAKLKGKSKTKVKIIFFSPSGRQFDTEAAKKFSSTATDIIFVCGRYEGVDARVKKAFKMELPAMIVIDTISRQIEGVLGDFSSLEETRSASADVYTRPEVFDYKKKNYRVPKVLLSGNHKKIEEWRKLQ